MTTDQAIIFTILFFFFALLLWGACVMTWLPSWRRSGTRTIPWYWARAGTALVITGAWACRWRCWLSWCRYRWSCGCGRF